MGRRSFEASLGPPYKGLNTYADPKMLAKDSLTAASWADLSRGVVEGYFAPSTIAEVGASLTPATRFVFYALDAGWISDTVITDDGRTNWACRDAPLDGNPVFYVTLLQADGSALNPLLCFGVVSYRLGIPAPDAVVVSGGASLGARFYSITQVDAYGNESNPTYIGTATKAGGATFTAPAYTANTTSAGFYVYGSNLDDVAGADAARYFIGQVLTGATFTDTGDAGNPSLNLDWGPGGTPASEALPGDHSEAPDLTCFSDGIHSALVSDIQSTGLGIAFAAFGYTVCWSMLGRTFYWPTFNRAVLPYPVLAMATRGAVTYAFTEGGVWSFSGVSDPDIQVHRVADALGVLRLAGKSVAQTPDGIAYLTRLGPSLLDGTAFRPFANGVLDQVAWTSPTPTYFAGAYYDGWYYLEAGVGVCYAFDMRRFPEVSITTVADDIGAFTIVPFITGGPTPSLYVCNNSSGHVYAWRPMDGANVAGATQQGWSITTARTDLGEPGKNKRARKVRAIVTGDTYAVITRYPGIGAPVLFSLLLTATQRVYLLPFAFDGVHFEVTFEAAAGATQLVAFSLLGEVWDGA